MADAKDRAGGEPALQAGSPANADTSPAMGVHHRASLEALREPVFFALIVLLAAAAGWMLLERSTDLPPLKRYSGFELDIGSPTDLPHYSPTFDAAGQLRVTDVEYSEDHGGTADYFPYDGGVEAHIGVRFHRPVVGDAPVQVVLELPALVGQPDATDCRPSSPIEPLELTCSVERLPDYAPYQDAVVMRGILHGQSRATGSSHCSKFRFHSASEQPRRYRISSVAIPGGGRLSQRSRHRRPHARQRPLRRIGGRR